MSQLSPESLEQIRQIVQEAIGGVERRLDRRDERFDAIDRRFDATDQRFDATDQRFDAMDQRFDAMDQRFDAMDQRFDATDQRFDAMDQRFDAMDQRFDAMDQRVDALQTESREGLAENRRHFGVLHEDLRDQIRLIAEGFATTNERIDRLEIGMHTEFARVDGRLRRLEAERPRRRRPPKR